MRKGVTLCSSSFCMHRLPFCLTFSFASHDHDILNDDICNIHIHFSIVSRHFLRWKKEKEKDENTCHIHSVRVRACAQVSHQRRYTGTDRQLSTMNFKWVSISSGDWWCDHEDRTRNGEWSHPEKYLYTPIYICHIETQVVWSARVHTCGICIVTAIWQNNVNFKIKGAFNRPF